MKFPSTSFFLPNIFRAFQGTQSWCVLSRCQAARCSSVTEPLRTVVKLSIMTHHEQCLQVYTNPQHEIRCMLLMCVHTCVDHRYVYTHTLCFWGCFWFSTLLQVVISDSREHPGISAPWKQRKMFCLTGLEGVDIVFFAIPDFFTFYAAEATRHIHWFSSILIWGFPKIGVPQSSS